MRGAPGRAGAFTGHMQRHTRQLARNREISRVAGLQAGVIGHEQLIRAGFTDGAIRHRVATGTFHRIFPGAYAMVVPVSLDGLRLAALLSTAPSFISHRDAAEVHRLWAPVPGPVHVTVARGRNLRRDGIVIHRTSHLHLEERRQIGPLRVTSAARTLVDVAGGCSPRHLTQAFDESLRLGSATRAQILVACDRARARPGLKRLRGIASERYAPFDRTRSRNEASFLRLCLTEGLPIPLVNVPLLDFEVDCLWTDSRLVVEVDGPHHDTPRARSADAARDAALEAAGYLVIRLRPKRFKSAPKAVAAELRATMEVRRTGQVRQ